MEARVTELRGQFGDIKEGLEAMLRGPHIRCESTGETSPPMGPGEAGLVGGALDLDSFLQLIDREMQQGHRSIEEEETGVAILRYCAPLAFTLSPLATHYSTSGASVCFEMQQGHRSIEEEETGVAILRYGAPLAFHSLPTGNALLHKWTPRLV